IRDKLLLTARTISAGQLAQTSRQRSALVGRKFGNALAEVHAVFIILCPKRDSSTVCVLSTAVFAAPGPSCRPAALLQRDARPSRPAIVAVRPRSTRATPKSSDLDQR